ncbi:hypothetical protein POM88_053195 [Heracleum sosnowskyi]|uniref:Replication protein A subunit n=1 Tax=Heracleum sosnowskyi TaxID=360622 RepID=A0AAD8GQR8_9APIA|nr:hypothetical protein POM88_053195 [Heracleum sosnowskyi]
MTTYDMLKELDVTRTIWNVRVRISRMWPSITSSNGTETLKGYNLILLDEDNCHVHAFIYADNWNNLSKKVEIVEGGLYSISNFYTKKATGSVRPVSSKILINFNQKTHIEKLTLDDFMIPTHKFEFVDLGHLFTLASSYSNPDTPDYAIDIIGALEDFEDVRLINKVNGEKNIVKFRITDGRHSSSVTVWGDLAVKTDEEYKKLEERTKIVIVTSTKAKIYKSTVQVNTLPSSKIYLNLDIDAVIAMRQRLADEGYTAGDICFSTPIAKSPTPVIETMTLNELSDITDADYIKKNVICEVKVISVEENNSWWHDSCGTCETEIEKKEGSIYCNTCKNPIPVAEKRYRIVILDEDSAEAYNFILKDRAGRRLVGTSATKLQATMIKTKAAGFPHQIKAPVGKDLKLKLEISKDNVVSKSRLYYAVDVLNTNTSSSAMSGATTSVYSTSTSLDPNVIQLSDGQHTPCTGHSTTKKIKVEK